MAALATKVVPKAAKQPETKPKSAPTARVAAPVRTPVFLGGPAPARNGGQPLAPGLQASIENSLQVNLDSVRVHTDSGAQQAARNLSARAFTYGNEIFLGRGERATDLRLMAHEAAHVVQQQSAPAIQKWSDHGDSWEHEAHQAAAAVENRQPFTVRERTGKSKIQRLGLSDVLNFFADAANAIPGFRMFTIIIGLNPINMSRVERSAANILRAIVEFIPGGALITQALDRYGVFDRVGTWIEQQISSLGISGSSIRESLNRFLDSLGIRDIVRPGSVWERARRIFTDPIDRIIGFVRGLGAQILTFIRDAILRPLAELASQSRGWDLLCAVLGRNPITGEAVPRTAQALIGGFMRLIGQEEVWENIQRANAIPRAWAWFQGALNGLLGFVRQIPTLFIEALRSLEIEDIVLLPRAFARVGRVFAGFAAQFFSWAGQQVWTLLEIIFDVLAPAVMPYLRRAASAFRTILRNPMAFVRTLVRAAIQGFRQFASNFLTHLRASLIQWLTGTLAGANIYIPQGFTFMEIIRFVLSVLGLTWQNIRQKLVRRIGETAVRAMEIGFDLVVTLVTQGPAAAWQRIQEGISNLREMVMEQVMTFVRDRIVQAAITRLLTSLNPAGAFIQAIIAIYNTIMFFVERLRQIAQVAAAFIDSISAIANGVITAAANRVEQTMAGLLTLVISFLARLVGLGRVSDAVVNIVNRIREPIDRALDRVVDWIVTMAQRAGRAFVGAIRGRDERTLEEKQRDLNQALDSGQAAVNRYAGRTVGGLVLQPLLAAIRLRYRLTRLEAVPDGENWAIEGQINPGGRRRTSARATAAPAPAPAHYLPGALDGFGRSTHVAGEPIDHTSLQSSDRNTSTPSPGKFLVPSRYRYNDGHLLPHSFGGPDTDTRNLAAISVGTNMEFSAVEDRTRRALRANTCASIRYEVTCHYLDNGPGVLENWMKENFGTGVSDQRFTGMGTLLFNMIKNRSWSADDIAQQLRVTRSQVITVEDNLKLKAVYCYLPQRFTIVITPRAGSVSIPGGNFDNHLPNPRNPYRPLVPQVFLDIRSGRTQRPGP